MCVTSRGYLLKFMYRMSGKKREPKYNPEEVEALVCGLEKHIGVISGKLTNTIAAEVKNKCWDDITASVDSVRGDTRRTREKVEEKWSYLKVK